MACRYVSQGVGETCCLPKTAWLRLEELYEEELSQKIIYLKEQNHEKINEISSNILINSMKKILQNIVQLDISCYCAILQLKRLAIAQYLI